VHLFEEGRHDVIEPVPGVKAVNTVGAGDAWCGGFISASYMGASAKGAVMFGNCCAACAIASHEPHSVPDYPTVLDMVRKTYSDI